MLNEEHERTASQYKLLENKVPGIPAIFAGSSVTKQNPQLFSNSRKVIFAAEHQAFPIDKRPSNPNAHKGQNPSRGVLKSPFPNTVTSSSAGKVGESSKSSSVHSAEKPSSIFLQKKRVAQSPFPRVNKHNSNRKGDGPSFHKGNGNTNYRGNSEPSMLAKRRKFTK